MLTWHVDRFFRAGPVCALVTLLLPMAMAALVNSQRTEDNILGILLVASGIIFIGSLIGSAMASGFGAVLFGLGTAVAEVPVLPMAVVGIGLYITFVIHDLSGAFHRGPRISPAIWRNAAVTTLTIAATSTGAFALVYFVAELTTWLPQSASPPNSPPTHIERPVASSPQNDALRQTLTTPTEAGKPALVEHCQRRFRWSPQHI